MVTLLICVTHPMAHGKRGSRGTQYLVMKCRDDFFLRCVGEGWVASLWGNRNRKGWSAMGERSEGGSGGFESFSSQDHVLCNPLPSPLEGDPVHT